MTLGLELYKYYFYKPDKKEKFTYADIQPYLDQRGIVPGCSVFVRLTIKHSERNGKYSLAAR